MKRLNDQFTNEEIDLMPIPPDHLDVSIHTNKLLPHKWQTKGSESQLLSIEFRLYDPDLDAEKRKGLLARVPLIGDDECETESKRLRGHSKGACVIICAFSNSKLVGQICLDTYAYLWGVGRLADLRVLTEHRRCGIGKMLIEICERLCKETNELRLCALLVDASDNELINRYKAWGFSENVEYEQEKGFMLLTKDLFPEQNDFDI